MYFVIINIGDNMSELIFGIVWTLFSTSFLAIMLFNAWILELLWNWLAPIFWSNAPVLSFWQTFGILFLMQIIANMFRSTK